MDKKVLVTGAPGFLGNQLIATLLKDNRKIVCLVHPSMESPQFGEMFPYSDKVEVIFADVRAPLVKLEKYMEGVGSVFNCAGMQHPTYTKEIYQVNRDAPAHLLQAAINAGVKKFVHVSSSAIHGENSRGEVLDEESPFRPLTHYAKSKAQGERLLQKHVDRGVTVSIIRPSVFYGSPASKNLQELMDGLRKGKKMPLIGTNGSLRSYVALQQVCDALLLAEKKAKTGEAFLITDSEPLTTKQFFSFICNGLGVECNVRSLPMFSSRIGEGVAMFAGSVGKHLRMANILGEFGRNHVVSNKKAVQDLGFKALADSGAGLEGMGNNFINGG